jgi:hypothetical protein
MYLDKNFTPFQVEIECSQYELSSALKSFILIISDLKPNRIGRNLEKGSSTHLNAVSGINSLKASEAYLGMIWKLRLNNGNKRIVRVRSNHSSLKS